MWCRDCTCCFSVGYPGSSSTGAWWDPDTEKWRNRCQFNSLLNSGNLLPSFSLMSNMWDTKTILSLFFWFLLKPRIKSFNPGHISTLKKSSGPPKPRQKYSSTSPACGKCSPTCHIHLLTPDGPTLPPALTANLWWWDLLGCLHGKNNSMYIKQSLPREKTRGAECLDVNLT